MLGCAPCSAKTTVLGTFWLRQAPAQDLALQPNFAKAYANLGLRQLSNGELDGTKASLPALFRQNPGWLGATSLSHGKAHVQRL